MDAAITARLRPGAERLDVRLDPAQLARFDRYLALLLEWNAHINLTSMTAPAEIVDRHFLDSLALAPLIAQGPARLVDVGSGAGFPGAVLAIARPELRVTCVESIRKKANFLSALRREVVPIEVVCARVESVTERFDVVVSRATWDPAEWLPIGAPLVAAGGCLIAMQGAEQPPLAPPAGFALEATHDWTIEDRRRRAVIFRAASA